MRCPMTGVALVVGALILAGCGARSELKLPPAEGPPPPPAMAKEKKVEYLKPPPLPAEYAK